MKKLLLLFFVIYSFSGLAQKFQDTIPFRNDLGIIIIPVSFNGVEKQFAFDTGAQTSVAYGWPEEELKKTRKTLTVTSSSGLKSRMRYYKSGTINIGSRKVKGHRILSAPRNDIFTCHKIDGILGVDITKELNWKIDYKNKILIMYPSNYYPEEVKEMHELDFNFTGNRPYVFLQRKDLRLKFLLDTGAGGSSNISKKNYNVTNLSDFPNIDFYSGSYDVNGIFTSTQPKIVKFPESTSKEVSLFPIIYFNDVKSSKLGNNLWKDHSLFLSLKNDRLFVSSSTIKQEYSSYSCSVAFQNEKMVISSIQKGSDIWNAGARQGDEIAKLDGQVFTDFCSLDVYRRSLADNRKPFTIELKSGETFKISVKKVFQE